MTSQPQPEPRPIPGQMEIEEVIALSEREDGKRLEHDPPQTATIHELAAHAVRAKFKQKEKE